MRLGTAIVIGTLGLALTACERQAADTATSARKVVETPKRKPGLWVQNTSIQGLGEVPAVSMCLDKTVDDKLAWWGQQGVRGGCIKNEVEQNDDGSWSFESVCQTVGNIRTATQGTATGDFQSAFKVVAETTTEGSPLPDMNGTRQVTMDYKWVGKCPSDMKPGDMKLPDGSIINPTRSLR